jgi:hypothetical protein
LVKLRLFKPYRVYLPTLSGLLIILALISVISVFIFSKLGYLLAYQKPQKSSVLVIDGWLSDSAFKTAAEHIKNNDYDVIITSGGPLKKTIINTLHDNYAEQAAYILQQLGVPKQRVISVPSPFTTKNRSYLTAITVRDWLNTHHPELNTITLFTGHVHARRSHTLYEMAFAPNKHIGIIAAAPEEFALNSWWNSSSGVKSVLGETISLTWTLCCFFPEENQ